MTSSPSFSSNDGALYGLPTINGYDPLIMERYILYLQASQAFEPNRHVLTTNFLGDPHNKLIKMLNVGYFFRGNTLTKLKPFFPKAVLVPKAVFQPEEKVLNFMKSDLFDPLKTVVFESEDQIPRFSVTKQQDDIGSCHITEYDNEYIRMRAATKQPSYLVLSEMYYPGWKATVNGKPVPILRGNYLFRVIPLEKGEHDIQMHFVSRPFQIGALVSIVTLLTSILFLTLRRKKNKKT
jgi:uncharacterized membrane protein YfhO